MNRREHRVVKAHLAKAIFHEQSFLGTVQNLCSKGVGLSANTEVAPGDRILLHLFTFTDGILDLEGAVAHRRELPRGSDKTFFYGIHVLCPNRRFRDYVRKLPLQAFDRREYPRYKTMVFASTMNVIRPFFSVVRSFSESGGLLSSEKPIHNNSEEKLIFFGASLAPVECNVKFVSSYEFPDPLADYPYGAGFQIVTIQDDDKQVLDDFFSRLSQDE